MNEDEEKGKKTEKAEETKKREKEIEELLVAPKDDKALIFEDGTTVAALGLGIHLIQDGKRRWVPNTWTQTRLGIRMDYVVMLFPEQLLSIPEGPPMPDQAPAEPLF